MNDQGQLYHGWTLVLRRRPDRIVNGLPEGGYTDEFEIICCDCGDDPSLDYREVPSELRRIRGPYPAAAGIAAYVKHARRCPSPQVRRPMHDIGGCSPVAGLRGSAFIPMG